MKLLFGGLIAIILLGLYFYATLLAVLAAYNGNPALFTPGIAATMTTVGGLVSALVIAELAVTNPGEAPGTRALTKAAAGDTVSDQSKKVLTWISSAYVLIWIVLGLSAYVVGVMEKPDTVAALTSHGQAWLGLAVASAYAYFGLTPEK